MRGSMRAMVGAGVLAVASSIFLGGATAHAAAEDTVTATGWVERGPFKSYAECERVRDNLAGLGYATQPCRYVDCGTAPGCVDGWKFRIWK